MDEAGFETAHIVGNSLGGYVALQLAARGRARLGRGARAGRRLGAWATSRTGARSATSRRCRSCCAAAAPHAEAIVASPEGRRRATEFIATNFEHIPAELLAHLMRGAAGCDGGARADRARAREGWQLDAETIACPVRIVWGTDDRILPWPSAAARYRDDWLPHADWVELDGVGHCPQLDAPLETAQLILGFARR